MSENILPVADYRLAGQKLVNDVGDLNVVIFDVPTFHKDYSFKNYPSRYLDKCVAVTVTISGCESDGINWALLAPYRLDIVVNNQEKVYDIDPMILALDNGSGKSRDAGYLAYHLNIPGRTTWVPGYAGISRADAILALRSQLVTQRMPLSEAPVSIKKTLAYMVEVVKKEILIKP